MHYQQVVYLHSHVTRTPRPCAQERSSQLLIVISVSCFTTFIYRLHLSIHLAHSPGFRDLYTQYTVAYMLSCQLCWLY